MFTAHEKYLQKWMKAMTDKGHSPYLNEDGQLDTWRVNEDIHNGPECMTCHFSFCMHCRSIKDIPECH